MTKKTSFDGVTKFFIVVIGLVVIGIVLKELSHICIPLLIAVFLFFVFSPFNNWLGKKKIPMFLIILLDLAITFAVLYGIGRVVVDSFFQFADGLPVYSDKLSGLIRTAALSLGIKDTFFTKFSFDNLVKSLNLQDIISGLFSSTFSLLGSVLFVLFFFVFVLSGNKTIYSAIERRYISKKAYPEPEEMKDDDKQNDDIADEV
ncbi:MAG: AI-2E family transporter, partial [Ignavibacteriaceae bacterium]|nr:AI-2E family transporter [Ignavibacteriaceae bacterium]